VHRRVIEGCLLESLEPGSSFIMADCPLDRISGKHVKMLRDRKAKVPEAANTRLKALRGLFKWGLANIDLAARFSTGINPARDVPSFRTYSTGHHTWTLEEVTQFEATHASGSTGISAHGAPVRSRQKIPFNTRRSSTRGTPRGLFGNSGAITDHSKSVN
jgi:hypothetical protein